MLILIICLLLTASCKHELRLSTKGGNKMILIPGGVFIMGTSLPQARQWAERTGNYLEISPFRYEVPQRKIKLPSFYIKETPVTNQEYLEFVKAGGYTNPKYWKQFKEDPYFDFERVRGEFVDQTGAPGPLLWKNGMYPEGKGDYPVTGVSWYEAAAYCAFKGWRLPTEAEWEKAARGEDGRTYPWGNEFDPRRANTKESNKNELTPVYAYPEGISPYGVYDMVGNVAEWTQDIFKTSERDPNPPVLEYGERVVKSDYFTGDELTARPAARSPMQPYDRHPAQGFRCACDAISQKGD